MSLLLFLCVYLHPGYWESPSPTDLSGDKVILGCSVVTKVFRRKPGWKRPLLRLNFFFCLPLFSSFQTFCSRSHSKHWSFLVLLRRDVWALQPLLCMCVSDQRLLLHHPLSHKAKVSSWTHSALSTEPFVVLRVPFTLECLPSGLCHLCPGSHALNCLWCWWP